MPSTEKKRAKRLSELQRRLDYLQKQIAAPKDGKKLWYATAEADALEWAINDIRQRYKTSNSAGDLSQPDVLVGCEGILEQ